MCVPITSAWEDLGEGFCIWIKAVSIYLVFPGVHTCPLLSSSRASLPARPPFGLIEVSRHLPPLPPPAPAGLEIILFYLFSGYS